MTYILAQGTHQQHNHVRGVKWCREVELPKNLYLQLDNTTKKQQKLVSNGFLLTTHSKAHFQRGGGGTHTHEDIDAFCGKLSESLHHIDVHVLANLMKAFMDSYTLPLYPSCARGCKF